MPTFNVLTEPFFTAVREGDGQTEQVSLLRALTRAHEFQEIRDPLPTCEFGIYRLLVALALDIFILEPGKKLKPLRINERLQRGRFDADDLKAIGDYAARYDAHFDLFSENRPFLQTASLAGEEKPVVGLLHPQPSGTNAAHFAHGHEDDFGVSPAAAARLLTSIAPFMTAGGQGLSPSINGAPPVYALVRGATLYETLWLNVYGGTLPLAKGEGRPAWHGTGMVGGARKTESSYAESLTWMPRRLQLMPGEGGCCSLTGEDCAVLVHTMRFAKGDGCDFAWTDPNCAYRIDKKGPIVLRLRKGRSLWRDTGPFALLIGNRGFMRPPVVSQAAEIAPEQPLRLTLYGMRTDMNAKVFEWQREPLIVPRRLVHGSAFVGDAVEGMEQAETAAYYLRRAIKSAYTRGGDGNKKAFDGLADGAERDYWVALQACYEALLAILDGLDANDGTGRTMARKQWATEVKDKALRALRAAVEGLDMDASALERQTRAFKSLEAGLYVLFLPPEEREKRRQSKKNKATAAAETKQGDLFA